MVSETLSWYFHGDGLASFGKHGKPVLESLAPLQADQILVRVDALGLCASDAKMLRLGQDYPLFFDRDFETQPARLGHEAALTVIAVGDKLNNRFHKDQRLGIQPDVFVDGERQIFGVNLPGAMTQFLTLQGAVLDYLFTVPDSLSHADVALLEPWACVDVAYSQLRRLRPKAGGVMWLSGQPGDDLPYRFNMPLASALVVLSDVPECLLQELEEQQIRYVIDNKRSADDMMQHYTQGRGFDDIVLLAPTATRISQASSMLAKWGTLSMVCQEALNERVTIDANQLHYDNIAYRGCSGTDLSQAYKAYAAQAALPRNRAEVKDKGVMLVYGAGGTMGRMHIQRALTMAKIRTIIAVNRSAKRVASLKTQFSELAASQGINFAALSLEQDADALPSIIAEHTQGKGCDDVVVIAPDVKALAQASQYLARDGVLNFFAGVPKGQQVALPLDWVALHGAQFIGTSGSTLADQQEVIAKTLTGSLAPSSIVAAVAGIYGLKDGIQAVLEGHFEGKVIIYPQLTDLPLMTLDELATRFPRVRQQLDKHRSWTKDVEAALFASYA